MKDSPDPPPPIDPQAIARAQMEANRQAMRDAARYNRTDQTTPWGSINWTRDANGVPTGSNITLNAQDQQRLDAQRAMLAQQQGVAQQFLNQLGPINFGDLHAVYDRYADNRQWTGNASQLNPTQRPQGPPQGGSQGIGPMPMQAEGGSQGMGQMNPLTRGAMPTQAAGPMAMANAVRNQGPPDSGQEFADPMAQYSGIVGENNPYGALGSRVLDDGLTQAQVDKLPEWLRAQYQRISNSEGEDFYRLEGGLRDREGNRVVQAGTASDAIGEGDNSVMDMSRVRYNPDLGAVTDPENRRSVMSSAHRTGGMLTRAAILAAAGYGAMGAMSGAGAEGAAAAAGGEGAAGMAIDPSLLSAIGGEAGAAIDPSLLAAIGGEAGGSAAIDPSLLASLGGDGASAFAGGSASGSIASGGWQAMLRDPRVLRSVISLLNQPRRK